MAAFNQGNFYPRPPRGGRRTFLVPGGGIFVISIHVPRVGDDARKLEIVALAESFLSTSPAWGTTLISRGLEALKAEFLSTSPAWGTTRSAEMQREVTYEFLSTSPAWGTT